MVNIIETKNRVVGHFREIKAEARKVVWPSRTYVIAATTIILIVIFIVAGLVLAIDYGFSKIFANLLSLKK